MKKKMAIGLALLVGVCGIAMATGLGESDWRCAGCNQWVLSGPDYVAPTNYRNRTYHSKCADKARNADENRRAIQAQKEEEAKKKAEREVKEAKDREERERQRQNERESERIRKEYPGLFIGNDFF